MHLRPFARKKEKAQQWSLSIVASADCTTQALHRNPESRNEDLAGQYQCQCQCCVQSVHASRSMSALEWLESHATRRRRMIVSELVASYAGSRGAISGVAGHQECRTPMECPTSVHQRAPACTRSLPARHDTQVGSASSYRVPSEPHRTWHGTALHWTGLRWAGLENSLSSIILPPLL